MSSLKNATAPLDSEVASKLAVVLSGTKFTGTVKNGKLSASDGTNSVSLSGVLLPDGQYSFDVTLGNDKAEATFTGELPKQAAPVVKPAPASRESSPSQFSSVSSAGRR